MRFNHMSIVGSLSFLAILANIVTAAANPQSFFLDVQLSDAYTSSTNCTDLNHWFLVEADIFVPQGPNKDIYLTVPEEFTSIPNDTFSLKSNSKTIGSVTSSSRSNKLRISYDGPQSKNMTASLNFLVQLTDDAKRQIKSPGSRNYTFGVTTGSSVTRSINYVAKDMSTLTSNGGIYADNNTAWFTADIPLSMLNRAVSFTSSGSSNASYQFNTSRTSLEIVVAVDAFNRPLRSFPFTAAKDKSDSSQIQLLINSRIDGGKYLRVKYYTEPLKTKSIGNTVSLNFASGLSKRDDSVTVSSNLYADSQANIQDQGTNEYTSSKQPSILSASSASNEAYETYSLETKTDPGVLTEIGTWIPISTLSVSQSATSSGEVSKTVISTSSVSSSDSSISFSYPATSKSQLPASSSISASTSNTGLTSSMESGLFQSSLLSVTSSYSESRATVTVISSADKVSEGQLFGVKSNSSDAYMTYSLITMTLDGAVVTFTSLYPVSTISESGHTQGYYLNSTTSVTSSTVTTESTSSRSGTMTVKPESTITASSQEKSSVRSEVSSLKPSYAESASSNTTISSQNTEKASISSDIEPYKTYSIETKDGGAVVTSYISLRAISTLKSVPTVTKGSKTGRSSVARFSTSLNHKGTSEATEKQNSVTSLPETSSTYFKSKTTTTKDSPAADRVFNPSSSSQPKASKLSTVTTKAQPISVSTSLESVSTKSSMVTTTNVTATSETAFTSFAVQTQLTSAEDTFTSLAFTTFEGRANRALTGSTGLAGIFMSFILLWV